jgi:pimeloyl-ACP methyl ester carboxylesterase
MLKRRFFTPLKREIAPREQQWLDRGEPFQIRVHGNRLHCWQWGHGPIVLVVHGWNGRGVNLHPLFTPLLEHGFAVVCFDAPAHGNSEGSTSNYFDYSDAVLTMVRTLGKENIAGLVAHSLGAAAVVNCLDKTGMRIPTVLIAPALRLRELLTNTFMAHGVPTHLHQSMIGELETTYGYSLETDNPFNLLKKQSDAQVLVIHDRDDALIPFGDARMLAHRHSSVRLYATRGLGHKRIIADSCSIQAALAHLGASPMPRERRQRRA